MANYWLHVVSDILFHHVYQMMTFQNEKNPLPFISRLLLFKIKEPMTKELIGLRKGKESIGKSTTEIHGLSQPMYSSIT